MDGVDISIKMVNTILAIIKTTKDMDWVFCLGKMGLLFIKDNSIMMFKSFDLY